MMHRPASTQIIQNGESYYSLVTAVAKRAREIARESDKNGQELSEKPVQIAVEEFAMKKYRLVEPENIGVKIE